MTAKGQRGSGGEAPMSPVLGIQPMSAIGA